MEWAEEQTRELDPSLTGPHVTACERVRGYHKYRVVLDRQWRMREAAQTSLNRDRVRAYYKKSLEYGLRKLYEPPHGIKYAISQEPLDYWKTPSK